MNHIERKFYNAATLQTTSLVLHSPEIAIAFITELKSNNIHLLGIDAFFIHTLHEDHNLSTIQPDMENSLDFSSAHGKNLTTDPHDYAIQFIRDNASKNLFYEIVCE